MRAVLDRPLRANFVSVSTALNRVAKLAAKRSRGGGLVNDEERKYLGILIKVAEELVDSDMVNARNLAQMLWSVAKLGNPEPSAEKLRRHPEQGLREIGPLKFGTTDRGNGTPPPVVEAPAQGRLPSLIAGKLSERACECKPMELAMAAWGLAVLGERDEACLSAIAREVSRRAGDFKGKELGNIVWAFAVLDYRDQASQAMLEAVAEVLSPEPLQWQGRVSWDWTPPRGWGAVRGEVVGGGDGLREEPVSAAMAAVGTRAVAADGALGVAGKEEGDKRTFSRLSSSSSRRLVAIDPPSAVAAVTGSSSLVDVAAASSGGDGGGGGGNSGKGLGGSTTAGVAGVGATVGGGDAGVGGGVGAGVRSWGDGRGHWNCASEVEVASVTLTPQDVAMLSWGFSALSQECLPCQPAAYRALAVLAKAARKCVGTFRPQDVSMVALALARMSWDDPELMMGLTARTTETLRAFKPQELSNTAWACARLYVRDPPFWSSLQTQAKRMLDGPGMKAQEIANLAWSLAVMGDADISLLAHLLRSAQEQRRSLTLIESHQLYQASSRGGRGGLCRDRVYLLWGKDTPELWADVSDKFLDALKRRWTDNQQRTKRSSFSHLEVSQMLDLMQISHENESEHDIDIEVVGVGLASEDWDFRSFAAGTGPNPADPAEVRLKLALEVDGPAHFTKNTARPLGHMRGGEEDGGRGGGGDIKGAREKGGRDRSRSGGGGRGQQSFHRIGQSFGTRTHTTSTVHELRALPDTAHRHQAPPRKV
eukprot:jgi/Undpi1/4442/HiC_scaffold_17.g07796.m1